MLYFRKAVCLFMKIWTGIEVNILLPFYEFRCVQNHKNEIVFATFMYSLYNELLYRLALVETWDFRVIFSFWYKWCSIFKVYSLQQGSFPINILIQFLLITVTQKWSNCNSLDLIISDYFGVVFIWLFCFIWVILLSVVLVTECL